MNKKKNKKTTVISKTEKRLGILTFFVIISFIVPIVFIFIRIIFNSESVTDESYHSDADYVLMIIQCLLGLVAINVPAIISKKLKFTVPAILYVLYMIFLYCAIFLGEVRSFYYVIPFWDDILHCMSSLMTGLFAFMLVTILNRDEKTVFTLSPGFVALFAFCFSVAIGAVWEIYEFTCDGVLSLNMQKFITADGIVLSGHHALNDTMNDLVVDSIGALLATVTGYISIKTDKKWIVPEIKTQSE